MLGTDKSEFLAVYGRRRVGKSFLVDEVYKSAIAFRTVGVFIKSEELTEELISVTLRRWQVSKKAGSHCSVHHSSSHGQESLLS